MAVQVLTNLCRRHCRREYGAVRFLAAGPALGYGKGVTSGPKPPWIV